MSKASATYEFGEYRADLGRRLLWRGDEPVRLTPKAFAALAFLVERAGEDVEKSAMVAAIWPDTAVEENNLTQAVSALRRALGESPSDHRFVVTVPGRGYRFVARVRRVTGHDAACDREAAGQSLDDPASASEFHPSGDAVESARRPGSAMEAGDHARRRPLDLVRSPTGRARPAARPIARHATSGVRSEDVRSTILAAALATLVAATGGAIARIAPPRPPARGGATEVARRVAVLPFALKTSGAGDDEYIGAGLAETLAARLGRLAGESGSVAFVRYSGTSASPADAARELGADEVLTGTVERVGDRYRIDVRLVDGRTGRDLWTDRFDGRSGTLVEAQERLSNRVAEALVPDASADARERATLRYTASPSAYEAYLRGRYFWNRRTDANYALAIESYERAIAEDPSYALAYSGLADAYVLLGLGEPDPAARARLLASAKQSALRAEALDDSLAEAHTSVAAVREVFDKDRAEAEREYLRALDLDPTYATAHQWYGEFLEADGRYAEATVSLENARRLDPLSLAVNVALGENLFYLRRHDDAIAQFRRTLELDPGFARARYDLGLALEQRREFDEAIAQFERVRDADAGETKAIAALAHAYATAGHPEATRRMVREFAGRSRAGQVEPYDEVILCAAVGDTDGAIAWLKVARDRHDGNLLWLSADPRLDALRADARYRAVVGG